MIYRRLLRFVVFISTEIAFRVLEFDYTAAGSKAAIKRKGEERMGARSRMILLIASLAAAAMAAPALARDDDNDRCAGARDLTLINGKIHTLDARNSIVSSVTIRNGKFAAVGREARSDEGRCMRTIDLHGRAAVPGLVDNHNHFLLLGLRPGHDTRLETAASIADVQAAIRARTKT
jgi:hypothetical protein